MPSSGFQTCALRSEEHTSELQSLTNLVCRLLLEKKQPNNNQAPQTMVQPQESESVQQLTATPKARESAKAEAWQIRDAAGTGDRTIARATASRVLGLMPDDAKARRLAEKALADDKPEVRSAAAAALGD